MSISVDLGTGQGVSSGTTVTPLAPTPGSYGFSVDDPGNTVMKNVVGGLDQPNAIRYSVTPVADVFKQSDLTAAAGQRTDGVSVLVQVTESWKVTDSVTGEVIYLPVSAHCVLKVPLNAEVTGARAAALMARLLGALDRDDSGGIDDSLDSIMHGVTRLPETTST